MLAWSCGSSRSNGLRRSGYVPQRVVLFVFNTHQARDSFPAPDFRSTPPSFSVRIFAIGRCPLGGRASSPWSTPESMNMDRPSLRPGPSRSTSNIPTVHPFSTLLRTALPSPFTPMRTRSLALGQSLPPTTQVSTAKQDLLDQIPHVHAPYGTVFAQGPRSPTAPPLHKLYAKPAMHMLAPYLSVPDLISPASTSNGELERHGAWCVQTELIVLVYLSKLLSNFLADPPQRSYSHFQPMYLRTIRSTAHS